MPEVAPSVEGRTSRAWDAGLPRVCRYGWRMSGVFGKRFGRMNSRTSVWVSSVKYSSISAFELRHVKYEYDCEKPTFARNFMIFGRVNASARKIVSGCACVMPASAHSQKWNGLVCGLSTRKIFTPRAIQNSMTAFSSCQSADQSSDSKSNG